MRKKETAAPLSPQFVAPISKREPPAIALPDIDVTPVWNGIADDSRDSVSAQDRAKAFLIRNAPIYIVAVVISASVVIMWTLLLWAFGAPNIPYALDKVLVFFLVLAGGTYHAHMDASKRDYEHSRAGVERLRVEAGRDFAIEQLRSRERITAMAYKQLTEGEDDDESGG